MEPRIVIPPIRRPRLIIVDRLDCLELNISRFIVL